MTLVLAITVLEVDCANISYEEARSLTTEVSQINKPTEENPTPLVAGIQILPGLLDGLIMVEVTPRSYKTSDIWIAYVLGVMSFDMVRHTHSEIYRSYIDVKIQGKSYIIEVASPDVEGIPYNGFVEGNATDLGVPEYFDVVNKLVNKQLAYNDPMEEASDYRKSDT